MLYFGLPNPSAYIPMTLSFVMLPLALPSNCDVSGQFGKTLTNSLLSLLFVATLLSSVFTLLVFMPLE